LNNYFTRLCIFLSSGFGIGYIKYAPGTAGTFLGILIFFLLTSLNIYFNILSLVIFVLVSIIICNIANNYYSEDDSKKIVLDEIAGVFVATYNIDPTAFNIIAIFILFRLFDIFKPFPISYIDEKLKNGIGIVVDDVVAGIYANITFLLASFYFVKIL
tara:strand:+ start:80 stop:553 length:474 start_codon:yes stop_codon:yes gene_type:complete